MGLRRSLYLAVVVLTLPFPALAERDVSVPLGGLGSSV